jgi:putative ABC transport system permease protein
MFFGVDPDKGFGKGGMMELEFRQGDTESAKRMLKLGRHIIVTDEFRQLKGLGVGDKLPLKTTQGVLDFTIAGVVWSPGIDVIATTMDLGRQFDQRTAASIFGTLDDARQYFGVDRIYLFAANLDYFLEKDELLKRVQQQVGSLGLLAGDVRKLKYEIQQGFLKLLTLVSTVAFCAMAVAALGVTNTIMASIRSRRWQFGVLRSIGVTRGMLLRMVLAESLLLGVIGVAHGLAAGIIMAIDAKKISGIAIGYIPPTIVPWGMISIGIGAVMMISFIASLWPAISVARQEPLSLLQAGRAAA